MNFYFLNKVDIPVVIIRFLNIFWQLSDLWSSKDDVIYSNQYKKRKKKVVVFYSTFHNMEKLLYL